MAAVDQPQLTCVVEIWRNGYAGWSRLVMRRKQR